MRQGGIKRQFIFDEYSDFTEEEKILYLQEGNDGNHNQITEEGGKLIDFDLYIFKYDREFFSKYKLLFNVDEIKKKYLMNELLNGAGWEEYGITNKYKS